MKVSIYLKDEEHAVYVKAKEIAEKRGETMGSILTTALQVYVRENTAGIVKLFIGTNNGPDGLDGKWIAFEGKILANGDRQEGNEVVRQIVYRTAKGKYVLYEESSAWGGSLPIESVYYSCDSAIELMEKYTLASGLAKAISLESDGVEWLDL